MKNTFHKLVTASLLGYTVLLSYWMLIGFGRGYRFTYSSYMYNLVPFKTIRHFLQFDKFNTEIWVVNLLGNIGVFMPFGFLLPFVIGVGLRKSYVVFFLGLFLLESQQFLLRRGSFDIDDFILNSVGFVIGYGMYKMFMMIKAKYARRPNEG